MGVSVSVTRKKTPQGKRTDGLMAALNGSHVLVGFPQGDPKLQRSEGTMSNASLAAIHNYGSPEQHIPPRPFMNEAMEDSENKRKVKILMLGGLRRVLVGRESIRGMLGKTGEFMVGAIKDSIRNGEWTPNKPRTIAVKGSSRPLIDTAQMMNSVSAKVVIR